MRNVGVFSKILAVAGTVLVLAPFVFMIITSVSRYISSQTLQVDYLIPAEFFMVDIPGALLLLWASLRTHTLRALTCTSVIAAIAFFLGVIAYSLLSGLASGFAEEKGLIMVIATILTSLFTLALLCAGITGIILTVKLFRYKKPQSA